MLDSCLEKIAIRNYMAFVTRFPLKTGIAARG